MACRSPYCRLESLGHGDGGMDRVVLDEREMYLVSKAIVCSAVCAGISVGVSVDGVH